MNKAFSIRVRLDSSPVPGADIRLLHRGETIGLFPCSQIVLTSSSTYYKGPNDNSMYYLRELHST